MSNFIIVSVRDARTALEALGDDRGLEFKTKGSNYFIFNTDEDFDTAMEILMLAGVEIEEIPSRYELGSDEEYCDDTTGFCQCQKCQAYADSED